MYRGIRPGYMGAIGGLWGGCSGDIGARQAANPSPLTLTLTLTPTLPLPLPLPLTVPLTLMPLGIPGASTLNFFVDFPAEATRNEAPFCKLLRNQLCSYLATATGGHRL